MAAERCLGLARSWAAMRADLDSGALWTDIASYPRLSLGGAARPRLLRQQPIAADLDRK